ncbi:cysteine hydrolase family protein [Pseudomonas fluorescens]|uniref:cysteine hydrolase family protein n=1 Tax=Pseudomonas fluorescens TaxID=294 RepID=UPI002ACA0748|nr:cysteine hydrolase family protein [Pseudomonas fluorescens]MDZ5433342.1 cysteine hydrolase family protein [Pseudomonas fluorescens]
MIDVQPSFAPPQWLIEGIRALVGTLPSVATVERHDQAKTPFQKQLGWHPAADDDSLIEADRIFIKHGYAPTPETIEYLKSLNVDRVLVCGLQTETCCLAAGFALFDAGLQPTLITDLTVGSSLDRSGGLGVRLWEHHFGAVVTSNRL